MTTTTHVVTWPEVLVFVTVVILAGTGAATIGTFVGSALYACSGRPA